MSQVTLDIFAEIMLPSFAGLLDRHDAMAIGVSGGPDSMALLWLLQGWCAVHDKTLHVLSIDHGLRDAAKGECLAVADYCEQFDHVLHEVLTWDVPSELRVQEEARKARYDLMKRYCERHDIQCLFLAHHQDDQAETVLFRLAKGSGLDGLSGIKAVQEYEGLTLCRPLLDVSKQDLVSVCEAHNIPCFDDPSNENEAFARVRLRQSMGVLSEEGLTPKRLAITAKRMARARDALHDIAQKAFEQHLLLKNTKRIEFKLYLLGDHSEIVIRVLLKAIDDIGTDKDYAPRMEKVEGLVDALQDDALFRKRTLGGVIFERDDKAKKLILMREKS